ncbi:hypothetical protein E0494_10550 [Marinilabiliaceae bacterium JC040]|nr:hypothetical protein [Marinilabiliaceae bacterium JC040]
MRTLGNILWHFPFLGFVSAFFTFLAGLFLTITIVAAPIGLGLIEYAKFLMLPFSSVMVSKKALNQKQNIIWRSYSFLVRIFYFPIGLIMSIIVIFQILGLCISIIGIPQAIILAKSLSTYYNPVNKVCISVDHSNYLANERARRKYERR